MSKVRKILALIVVFVLLSSGCVYQDIMNRMPERPQPVTEQREEESEAEEIITPKNGGTLNISMRKPSTLNPILNNDYTVDQTLKLIFDDLLMIDEQLNVKPSIAERWELDGDKLSIWINRNHKWHDGVPITAKDVIFTLKAISESDDSSTYKNCLKNIKSYDSVTDDETQLQITFNQQFSGALHSLCFPVIPEHYYSNPDLSTDMPLVGSGRYKFVEMNSNKEMVLLKNEEHPKKPYIENIIVKITNDNETDLYSFEQNMIDAIATNIIDWGKHSSGTTVTNISQYTSNYYDFLGFNFGNIMLADKNIRQAIACMIPKEQIINEYYLGHSTATDTPINPKSWLYENDVKKYPYSLEMAKTFLHLGGFIDSDNTGIISKDINGIKADANFHLLVNIENIERVKIANRLKDELLEIGIYIEVLELPFKEYVEKLVARDFDMFLGGWELSLIPDYTFAFHSSQISGGKNYINYNDSRMDELLEATFMAQNRVPEAYSELQKYISEELPYVSILFRNSVLLTNKKIRGNISPVINNIYSSIDEWFIYD